MAIDPQIFAEFLIALGSAASRSARAAVLDRYADRFGVTAAHLRRLAKREGFNFGYRKRTDSGKARDPRMVEAAKEVVKLIVASDGKMPTYVAIERAIAIGWVDADLGIEPWYVDRYIRDHGIRRQRASHPRETRRVKWGQPGRVIQLDSTNCAQWFLFDGDGYICYASPGELYHNKREKAAPIIRYVATDPTSGCFRVRYYQVDNERADTALEFLYWVMSRADRPELMPMAGVPDAVVVDPGPGNKSAAFINACDALDIDHRAHTSHHPWVKGSVETHMNIWERYFESELAFWPARSVDELNERAEAANAKFCSTRRHSRHGLPRSEFYAEHIGEIRLPPAWEIFVEAAHTTPQTRTVVGGSIVSYEGRDYYVGALAGCGTGDKVQIAKAILDWSDDTRPVRIAFGDQSIIEQALVQDAAGNYLDERVYQRRGDEHIAAEAEEQPLRLAEVRQAPQPQIDLDQQTRYTPPALRPPVIKPVVAGPTRSRSEALLELADRLGRELTRWEVTSLGWDSRVTAQQITAAADILGDDNREAGGRAASSA